MNDLKKVLLAGIGLTAMTVDKADSFVKELVEKGRLTVKKVRNWNKSSNVKVRKKLKNF